jgi:hypothetical protein
MRALDDPRSARITTSQDALGSFLGHLAGGALTRILSKYADVGAPEALGTLSAAAKAPKQAPK